MLPLNSVFIIVTFSKKYQYQKRKYALCDKPQTGDKKTFDNRRNFHYLHFRCEAYDCEKGLQQKHRKKKLEGEASGRIKRPLFFGRARCKTGEGA